MPAADVARSFAPSHTRRVAALGTATVVAYAVLAAVQIFVLGPLAAAPDRSLAVVYADLATADSSVDALQAIGVLLIGPILGSLLLLVSRAPQIPAGIVAVAYLALLVAGAPGYFVASFGANMALADAYGIGGGDHSPWSAVLYATSAAAAIAAVLVAVITTVRLRGRLMSVEPAAR